MLIPQPSFIIAGLRSHNLDDFHTKVKEYGNFSADYASQIYSTVTGKLNAASGAGEAFERAAPEAEPAPKAEEEPKWGLQVRHVYNPAAQPKGKSVLGTCDSRCLMCSFCLSVRHSCWICGETSLSAKRRGPVVAALDACRCLYTCGPSARHRSILASQRGLAAAASCVLSLWAGPHNKQPSPDGSAAPVLLHSGLDVLAKKKREENQTKARATVSLSLDDEEAAPAGAQSKPVCATSRSLSVHFCCIVQIRF